MSGRKMEVEAVMNLSPAGINHDVAIMARLIRPNRDDLSPEAAQAILALDFDPQDRDRMHQLALKAQEGTPAMSRALRDRLDAEFRSAGHAAAGGGGAGHQGQGG